MAASFGSPLAQVACNQMTSLDTWQKAQLEVYKATLKELYADVTPQQVDQLLDALAEQAGFYDCDYLNDSTVWQRAFYHKRMFRENYQHIPMLIER